MVNLGHQGSGGNGYSVHPLWKEYALPNLASDAPDQLYHLITDPAETQNLVLEEPQIAQLVRNFLQPTISAGRSRY